MCIRDRYKHDENGRAGFVRFLESIGYQEA